MRNTTTNQLEETQIDNFFRIYKPLLIFTYEKTTRKQKKFKSELDAWGFMQKKLYSDLKLFDAFVDQNPENLTERELGNVLRWKRCHIKTRMYAFRELKKYFVFLDPEKQKAYGVLSLHSPWAEMFAVQSLPLAVEVVLLPFEEKIITDGLIKVYPVMFGGGIRSELKEIYRKAKKKYGIITSLGI